MSHESETKACSSFREIVSRWLTGDSLVEHDDIPGHVPQIDVHGHGHGRGRGRLFKILVTFVESAAASSTRVKHWSNT
jgi:hypothetical protein